MTHVSELTPQGIQALAKVLDAFAQAKPETFALFDSQFDSAAESEAAKTGWSSAVTGLSLVVLSATLYESKKEAATEESTKEDA